MKDKIISKWVEAYTDDLYARAKYKISDSEIVADLVQDTFLAAFNSFESFKKESSPRTWLLSILNNKIIDYYRKKYQRAENRIAESLNQFNVNNNWVEEKAPREYLLTSEFEHSREFDEILKLCLTKLSEMQVAAVQLKFLKSFKGEEICQDLGISPSNYWQVLHRAKLKLRECFEKYWIGKK